MNNERKYFEIAQNLDPLIIKNVEFIFIARKFLRKIMGVN